MIGKLGSPGLWEALDSVKGDSQKRLELSFDRYGKDVEVIQSPLGRRAIGPLKELHADSVHHHWTEQSPMDAPDGGSESMTPGESTDLNSEPLVSSRIRYSSDELHLLRGGWNYRIGPPTVYSIH